MTLAALLLEVVLSPLFGDHAVVQAGKPVPVWGRAAPGEEITVTLGKRTARGTTGADGRWRVVLEPQPAGGPFDLAAEGYTRAASADVLVGEVWIASGQSNMALAVGAAGDPAREAAAAEFPGIRMFAQATAAKAEPAADATGSWKVCSPATVGGFSAVGYAFAREIHRALGVPVGILDASVGATPAEAWTPPEALAAEPALKGMAGAAKAGDPRSPGALWNGMAAPLLAAATRGAIWYQGESNASRAYQYRILFPAMIRGWRRARGEPEWPFLFVQLPNFGRPAPSGGPSEWAELREAQAAVLAALPGTGMAVAIDIGDAADLHPKNKREVGRRLALWALARTYGKDVPFSGPLFRSAKADGARLRIAFDHAAGLKSADGRELSGFAVAGADGKFRPGRATVDGETVLVADPEGGRPAAVRYAWADSPEGLNLVNAAGLPAGPFRTDDFPWITEGKE